MKLHIILCFYIAFLFKLLIVMEINIKKIRNKLGLSQKELAKKLGVHWRTVQNWENGTPIPLSKYTTLCALEMTTQKYAGGEQENVHEDISENNIVVQPDVQLEKMVEILTLKEKSLQKAQEHIDKLLEIINNITKDNNDD